MLASFHIKNFKNLTLETLGRINLIVGRNNVGKSSLLEAISIYVTNGEENWLRELLANRGKAIQKTDSGEINAENVKQHYISLFSGWEENYSQGFEIELGTNDKEAVPVRISQVYIREGKSESSISMETFNEELLRTQAERSSITNAGLHISNGLQSTIIPYNKQRSYLNVFDDKCPFQYIPVDMIVRMNNAKLFDKISLSPDEDYVLDALRIINPAINRIRFIDTNEGRYSERIAIVTLEGSDKRYRLGSMGDGINRILTIVLALLNCKNGILLLDEFETGLHYSIQTQLWQIVFMLAEKLDVQVFVTSHSNDCIRSFTKANTNGLGQLIRLTDRNGVIVATTYPNNDDIRFAIENDLEIR